MSFFRYMPEISDSSYQTESHSLLYTYQIQRIQICNKVIYLLIVLCNNSFAHGVLAQLGARIAGSDEVTGSSPVCSTMYKIRGR